MVWKWVDGVIAKAGCQGHPTMSRTFPAAEPSDKGTGSSMRGVGLRSNRSDGADDPSRKSGDRKWVEPGSLESNQAGRASAGGDIERLVDKLRLEQGRPYMHAAPASLFTHVEHGCLASHL